MMLDIHTDGLKRMLCFKVLIRPLHEVSDFLLMYML